MQSWICKYCHKDYLNVRLCVYHELEECDKNPKFKYTLDNTENGDECEEVKKTVIINLGLIKGPVLKT